MDLDISPGYRPKCIRYGGMMCNTILNYYTYIVEPGTIDLILLQTDYDRSVFAHSLMQR